jgi:hypothetical protein
VLHENESDRINQGEVAGEVKAFLDSLPITGTGLDGQSHWVFQETLQELVEPHDFVLMHQGKYVGVLEVKCREGRYTKDYLVENGALMETSLLNKMRTDHHKYGRHVLFAMRSSDGVTFITNLKTLMQNRDQLQNAPDGAVKDNHGKKDTDRGAVITPISLWKEI